MSNQQGEIEKELERLDNVVITGRENHGSNAFELTAIIDPVVWLEEIRPEVGKSFKKLLLQERQNTIEEIDGWIKNMLYEHDGSDNEYNMWLKQWKKFKDKLHSQTKEKSLDKHKEGKR